MASMAMPSEAVVLSDLSSDDRPEQPVLMEMDERFAAA